MRFDDEIDSYSCSLPEEEFRYKDFVFINMYQDGFVIGKNDEKISFHLTNKDQEEYEYETKLNKILEFLNAIQPLMNNTNYEEDLYGIKETYILENNKNETIDFLYNKNEPRKTYISLSFNKKISFEDFPKTKFNLLNNIYVPLDQILKIETEKTNNKNYHIKIIKIDYSYIEFNTSNHELKNRLLKMPL